MNVSILTMMKLYVIIAIKCCLFDLHIQAALGEQQRRVLQPTDNVAEHIRQLADVNGEDNVRLTITARVQDNSTSNRGALRTFAKGLLSQPKTITMDVIKASSAIKPTTRIISPDGSLKYFGDTFNSLNTLLVSDTTTASGRSGLTILTIDQNNGLYGISERTRGRAMKIRQDSSEGVVTAVEDESRVPEWKCGVDKSDDTLAHRGLEENLFNHDGKNSSLPYTYQVDLFLEIDHDFINRTGGGTPDAAGITPAAYNYINTLVTSANVVYEAEIGTHLNVHTIKLSTLYDNANGLNEALDTMQIAYGGDEWHSEGVDLHHGLFGKDFGGGKARIGVLCNPGWGFGLSSGLKGDFVSLDSATVRDMKLFMHELGHQFAGDHTHETDWFSPAIDTCGTICPETAGNKWSTLMSLCNNCPGEFDNIMYTYGGIFVAPGDSSDMLNWIDLPSLVENYDSTHESVDPRRQPFRMYKHISSRGECLLPRVPPTSVTLYATYDSTLQVPKCAAIGKSCSTGTLLLGRGNVGPAEGGTGSNNLDGCVDGTNGSHLSSESVERITISSVNEDFLTVGRVAEVTSVVFVWSITQNFIDFYSTDDPSNPNWHLINTLSPAHTGLQSIRAQFFLGGTAMQAVRVVVRYDETESSNNASSFTCPLGGYDDIDDLVFAVALLH